MEETVSIDSHFSDFSTPSSSYPFSFLLSSAHPSQLTLSSVTVATNQSIFIPNYSFKQLCIDTLWGATYPFRSATFWQLYWIDFLCSVAYFVSCYTLIKYLLKFNSTKREAWVLSLLSSCVVFPLSIPIAILLLQSWFEKGGNTAALFFMSSSRFAEFLCIFFYCFLFLDVLIGVIFYRDQFNILTGWLHHFIYACLTANALCWKYTNGIMSAFLEELPTIILASGHIFPAARANIVFGITFFCTRVVYHVLLIVFGLSYVRIYSFCWIFGIIALALHVWWLIRWFMRIKYYEEKAKDMGINAEENEYILNVNDDDYTYFDQKDNNNRRESSRNDRYVSHNENNYVSNNPEEANINNNSDTATGRRNSEDYIQVEERNNNNLFPEVYNKVERQNGPENEHPPNRRY